MNVNPLNAELNPICHLLALLGAHHILPVSRIRVKYCVCLYPWLSSMQRACALLNVHHCLINGMIYEKKLLNVNYGFLFSLQLCMKIF